MLKDKFYDILGARRNKNEEIIRWTHGTFIVDGMSSKSKNELFYVNK